jgi:hypothetical protein
MIVAVNVTLAFDRKIVARGPYQVPHASSERPAYQLQLGQKASLHTSLFTHQPRKSTYISRVKGDD